MLTRLHHLYNKQNRSNKTPLEDFTTEAFVGILETNLDFKKDFLYNFLELPEGEYGIFTQQSYKNCIIDIVIESRRSKIICFIENKVNAREMPEQLIRYGKILDSFKIKDYDTRLIYCTKNYDLKNLEIHHFKYIRWYQIAERLKSYTSDSLTNDFYSFLQKNKMAKKQILSNEEFVTIKNMANTIEIINDYLDEAKFYFIKKYKSPNKGQLNRQLKDWNRWIYSIKGIIKEDGGESDFNFGFYFNEPKIYVGIYVDYSVDNYYDKIFAKANNFGKFKSVVYGKHGTVISLERGIIDLENNEASKKIVIDWFKESFKTFEEFFMFTNDIPWDIFK